MGDPIIHAGRDAKGNAVATGQGASATAYYQETVTPNPDIDILAALQSLRDSVSQIAGIAETRALTRLTEAIDEVEKPAPQGEEVGTLVVQSLGYAKKAIGFADSLADLIPKLQTIGSWLGQDWSTWKSLIGVD
ncbi:hypothetical protein CKO38_15460 [Rhodospirillum rubrum]|uniref:hypothetical protein n=1 Tax=Rhodospirillum rubrum TaxID=1085 RepID=UPI001903A0FC|nr:hypothetical protein [Rhodospirillum rubrum]MBK1665920.1 hypothetical protein [Rhodospirillum rubrum]MBK1678043.1 hypothetical protein [Rhodospirillum rubrum]